MLLRTEVVEQLIDTNVMGSFVKEVHMTRGQVPLGIVRKRRTEGETVGTLVLVHGFGQNRYAWHTSKRSMVNYLASRGWDVFNIDLRGHGRSRLFGASTPRGIDDYIQSDMKIFAEEIQKASGRDRFFLVGHSMGGLISYSVAATSLRKQVRGVVSIGSPYRFGRGSFFMSTLRELSSMLKPTGVLDFNFELPVRQIGTMLKKRRAIWDLPLMPMPVRGWAPRQVEDDILAEYLEKSFERTTLSVALDIFQTGARNHWKSADGTVDYRTSFEHLDRPLLVIAGTVDDLAPPGSVKPAFEASRSADKTFRAFPLGHVDLIMGKDAPLTVWQTVGDWLELHRHAVR